MYIDICFKTKFSIKSLHHPINSYQSPKGHLRCFANSHVVLPKGLNPLGNGSNVKCHHAALFTDMILTSNMDTDAMSCNTQLRASVSVCVCKVYIARSMLIYCDCKCVYIGIMGSICIHVQTRIMHTLKCSSMQYLCIHGTSAKPYIILQ